MFLAEEVAAPVGLADAWLPTVNAAFQDEEEEERARFYRLSEPLAPGNYQSFGAFYVVENRTRPGVVPPTAEASLALKIGNNADFGQETHLDVFLTSEERDWRVSANYALFVRATRTATQAKVYVVAATWRDPYGERTGQWIRLWRGIPGLGLFEEGPVCLEIAGLSYEGELGPRRDLGCVDASNPADPRVTVIELPDEAAGCGGVGGTSLAVYLALLVLLCFMRRKNGPPRR